MKLQAILKPLSGKYYGSVVEVSSDGVTGSFEIWTSIGKEPSDRELENLGLTRRQWDNNEVVVDELSFSGLTGCRDADYFCDNHYETQFDYLLAKTIVNSINEIKIDENTSNK